MQSFRNTARLWLRRLLATRRGEMQAIHDVRYLSELFRFVGLFAGLIMVPALLLGVMAWTSVRSSELSFDEDLRVRSQGLTTQVRSELELIISDFERQVRERLERDEDPTTNGQQLSIYLRGVFRLAADGRVAGPFLIVPEQQTPTPAMAYSKAAVGARLASRDGDHPAALELWKQAVQFSNAPMYRAEATLGLARSHQELGDFKEVKRLWAEVSSTYGALHDRRGFRFLDLVALQEGAVNLQRGDPTALRALTLDLLSRPWTLGEPGEAAVARRAVQLLENHAESDWIVGRRTEINERVARLYWASQIKEELELLDMEVPDNTFRYIGARSDSPGFWALYRSGEQRYAFSFSALELLKKLGGTAAQLSKLDPDLSAVLLPSDETDGSFSTRSLSPWLPIMSVSAGPANPLALSARKSSSRNVRIAVIVLALFLVFTGILFAAQLVSRELDNARVKSDFAANVSHELRSPITQIRLKGEALQLGLIEEPEAIQAHYDAIVRESERLSRLVDNVLDFAAIERGKKTYHLRPDDLAAIVWRTIETHRQTIEKRGISVHLELPEDLPPVNLDREAMGQVVTNLLSNAAKYGAEGEWIGVTIWEENDEVHLAVADRGPGISAADQAKVFEHFFRSEDPKVRAKKGTGIGLAIVRYIVEAHRGSIEVKSSLGRGCTFVVVLPVSVPNESA